MPVLSTKRRPNLLPCHKVDATNPNDLFKITSSRPRIKRQDEECDQHLIPFTTSSLVLEGFINYYAILEPNRQILEIFRMSCS